MATPRRFSIVTPVHDPPGRILRAMLDSVARQRCGDWEHCLVDDGSIAAHVRPILAEAAAADPRVRVGWRSSRGGIVAATSDALAMAEGEFVAFLDHDDELHPRALEAMAEAIASHPDADYLYSDEDKIDERGRHYDPFLKPDFSPDRLRCQMYTAHLSAARRSLVESVGGMRAGFEGAQDWDLVLRITERARTVVHVPEILYHWRALPSSAARRQDAKPWAHEASRRAVAAHLERTGVQATVEPVPGYAGTYWLRPALREQPMVSIVIPTAGRAGQDAGAAEPLVARCLRSILERSTYRNIELVVVADAGMPAPVRERLHAIAGERLRELADERLRIIPYDRPFNFAAKINVGAAASRGSFLLLLNDDIEVVRPAWREHPPRAGEGVPAWPVATPDGRRTWIESMLAYALQPGVGAVGAKLYLPDGRLQHAGVVALGGLVGHPYYHARGEQSGYAGNLLLACDYLAVTAACLLTPRSAFEAAGGFDELFPVNYNDVDFCLKLRELGLRSVVLPEVELLHRESTSRGPRPPEPEEIEALRRRWGGVLGRDPYYHPRFAGGDFRIAGYTARGEFRPTRGVWHNLIAARRAFERGGSRLLLRRALAKARREAESALRRLGGAG